MRAQLVAARMRADEALKAFDDGKLGLAAKMANEILDAASRALNHAAEELPKSREPLAAGGRAPWLKRKRSGER